MKRVLLSLLVFSLLAGLGVWQLQRLAWKEGLIASIRANAARPPLHRLPTPADEYRRAALSGHFVPGHVFLLGPRVQNGVNGWHLFAPFAAQGGIIFVDRGWVPGKTALPAGKQVIEGLVRLPHKNAFTPENVPEKDTWYWADTAAMAKAAQLGPVPAVFVAVGAADPLTDIRNDHKQYAAFWFCLAILSQIIFYLRFRKA